MENLDKLLIPVLLVDDQPANLLAYETLLEDEKVETIRANSGQEALDILNNRADIGLILLDIQMPIMNGIEVAEKIKNSDTINHVPIIFVTALGENEEWKKFGYESGAIDYLGKPIKKDLLLHKVRSFREGYKNRMKLEFLNKELIEKQELLDKFVYIVSHDLNAPARQMTSVAEMLKNDLGDKLNEADMQLMNMIIKSSKNMSHLVKDLFAFCKGTKNENPELISVHDIIDDVISNQVSDNPINFILSLDHLNKIKTSPSAVRQIFDNLISNAIKYGPKEGLEIQIIANQSKDSKLVEFLVRDNGPGIHEKFHANLFEMLNTAGSKASNSTGIGLYIVKTMVERMKGSISLESILEEGTTFKFTIEDQV